MSRGTWQLNPFHPIDVRSLVVLSASQASPPWGRQSILHETAFFSALKVLSVLNYRPFAVTTAFFAPF